MTLHRLRRTRLKYSAIMSWIISILVSNLRLGHDPRLDLFLSELICARKKSDWNARWNLRSEPNKSPALNDSRRNKLQHKIQQGRRCGETCSTQQTELSIVRKNIWKVLLLTFAVIYASHQSQAKHRKSIKGVLQNQLEFQHPKSVTIKWTQRRNSFTSTVSNVEF